MGNPYYINDDTIAALATAPGTGAIAIIRLSGNDALRITDTLFTGKNLDPKKISEMKSHTVHYGILREKDVILDEVLVSVFRAPHSYTGEDVVEISCHGSRFIQQQILHILVKHGARLANPGEFTFRAFLNKRVDLTQAEAVADLIASTSSTAHQVALSQMRGGFSGTIKTLRENLVNFASLVELELDFSEEDVEFADREDLRNLIISIQKIVNRLIHSFEVGNVIKNGIPVAIIGKPNAGKSTLLNALLEEEKAIVSEIPGTTRDAIEDEITIDGILFRFIDTAGIRESTDAIESLGIRKTFEKIKQSAVVLYIFDVHEITSRELDEIMDEVRPHLNGTELVILGNKIDKEDAEYTKNEFSEFPDILFISAKEKKNIGLLKKKLIGIFDSKTLNITETVVTNARHAEALRHTAHALNKVLDGLNHKITGDLLSADIRTALHHLGLITGEITTDDLLENIFSRFCIGK